MRWLDWQRLWGLLLLTLTLPALAGVPKTCRPDATSEEHLAQAAQVFRADAPAESEVLWNQAMDLAAQGPPCRVVETAWRIGDFLKLHHRTSPDLALSYLNRGLAAYRPEGPSGEWSLAKLLKTSAQFFRRRGDTERACRGLQTAIRLFAAQPDGESMRRLVEEDLERTRCPPAAP